MLHQDYIQSNSNFILCNLREQSPLLSKFELHLREDLYQHARQMKMGLIKQEPYLQVFASQLWEMSNLAFHFWRFSSNLLIVWSHQQFYGHPCFQNLWMQFLHQRLHVQHLKCMFQCHWNLQLQLLLWESPLRFQPFFGYLQVETLQVTIRGKVLVWVICSF